jgi:lysozyme
MTTKYVDMDIRQDEGFRADAYPDPLSGGDPWTIGFGSTGPDIAKGVTWTLAQAVADQIKRRQSIEVAFDQSIGWWRSLCDERQDVLVNMAYNLGTHGVLAFHHMLAAAQAGDFKTAAAEMLASTWATQVKRRATRLANQMLNGVRVQDGSLPVHDDDFAQDATKTALG